MTLKLGMEHCICRYYKDCSNYDPGLILIHFMPRSNLVNAHFGFCMGKSENYMYVFSGKYCSHRPPSWLKHSTQ